MVKLNNQQWVIIITVGILLLFIVKPKTQFQDEAPIANQFLEETGDFDFTPELRVVANNIASQSLTDLDAIKNTLIFVHENVRYNSKVSIAECYNEKASDVLASGVGDCVSMTRLTISLLRLQGIPARSVGGCIDTKSTCGLLFAVLPEEIEIPKPDFQLDFKKRGFLHEWAEAWTEDKGWVLLETTAGKVYSTDCDSYIFYSYDSNPQNRCVINDQAFFNQCLEA